MENTRFFTDTMPAAVAQHVPHPAIDVGTELRYTSIARLRPGMNKWLTVAS